jgi:hypothetical protein
MEAVEASRQAQVGAVVHDELDAWSEPRPEFASLGEHLPGVARLVAVLEQCAAGGREFFGGGEHGIDVWETTSVENGV